MSTYPQNRIKSEMCLTFQCPPKAHTPVYSPRISLDMMTVKIGAELFTVSANDTATFFRLTKPRTTVVNLTKMMDTAHLVMLHHVVKPNKSDREGTHLIRPTNNMIIKKLGGYSVLDLCWYRQQGMNIFRQPMTVVDSIWTAPGEQMKVSLSRNYLGLEQQRRFKHNHFFPFILAKDKNQCTCAVA